MGLCLSGEAARSEAGTSRPVPSPRIELPLAPLTIEFAGDSIISSIQVHSECWQGSGSDSSRLVVERFGSVLLCAVVTGSGPSGTRLASFLATRIHQVGAITVGLLIVQQV